MLDALERFKSSRFDMFRPMCRRLVGALLTTFSLIIITEARAQETTKDGVRRLTHEQNIRVIATNQPKLQSALQLLQEGKPVEAIPVVNEIIALEREVLRAAASNPVEVEPPQSADTFARGLAEPGMLGRRAIPGVPAFFLDTPHTPTLRAFQGESLRSLELLEQLHETLGDYKAAKGVSEEIAGIVAKLVGKEDWQVTRAREDILRLDRLASLERDRPRALESARKATALVATVRGPLGTAFCIDPQGLFLTLDEVANPPSASVTTHFEYDKGYELSGTREERSPKTVPMALVLNLGTPDVKQLPVRILWKDKESRLALLKADPKEPLPTLELANGGTVVPGKEAVALGLAFVSRIPNLAASPTPTVRARPGRVTSIRERRGRPWFYQLDSTPPPGYSGGPVLDPQGRVIGMIVEGLPGTDIHYILPVDTTAAPFAMVVVDFEPPPLLFRDRHSPMDWTVRIYSKTLLTKDATVEIRLGTGSACRIFPARPTGERVYTARVVPVAVGEADPVGLTLEMAREPVRATVADREMQVGGTAIRLSELRRVEQGPEPRALTADGRRLLGPVAGLGILEGRRDKPGVVLDARRAPMIFLECPAPDAEPIEAEVVVKKGREVLGRVRKTLGYTDPPFETSLRIDPAKVGFIDVPRPVELPDVSMAVAAVSREPKTDAGTRDHSLRGVHDYSTAFSPDGHYYADGGDDNVIQLFDSASGRLLWLIRLDSWVQSIDFSPDSRTLLAAAFQKQLHLLDVGTGRDLGRFEDPHEPGLGQSLLSPDGRLAISLHDGGKLLLWNVTAGTVLRRPAETTGPCGFCFTPDGRNMLVLGKGPTGMNLRLSDARSGDLAWTIPSPGGDRPVFVGCAAAGTDLFFAAFEPGVVFWGNLTDGKLVRKLTLPNPIRDGCAALSPDGRRLITGHPDNALRLWDIPRGALIERIPLESVPTGPPRFSPDGAHIIANSFRGRLIFHRIPAPDGSDTPLVRRLPGKIASLAVGGAGRYLLLQLKGQRRLAVFDAHRADLSGVVELADDDALITANAEKGYVAYPRLRLLDRIDLESARVDRSAAFPLDATPRVFLAGPASEGPLLSIFETGRAEGSLVRSVVGFLDPDTMSLIAPRTFRRKGAKGWVEVPGPVLDAADFVGGKQSDYPASPSGDVFCYGSRNPSVVCALNGDVVEVFETPNHDGGFLPTIARRSLLTKSGRFDFAGSPLASLPDSGSILGVIPAHEPAYYLLVRSSSTQTRPGNPPLPVLEVYSAASDRRLFAVNGLDEMKGPPNNELMLGQRYHLIPSARLLVTIPVENDRLVVRRLDVLGQVSRLVVDEIVVTSLPVVGAVAGEQFRHRVEAYARGGATFERSDGPEHLSVSPAGEMRWDVPKGEAGQETVAVVAVRSASGQTVLHKVHVLVRKRG